ncbi:hypothetical protein [Micrococcus lylae]|nr:hypothetical protein [Micrococcus lylae]
MSTWVYFHVSDTGLDARQVCKHALDCAHVAPTPGRPFASATDNTHVRLF